jgi:hypothetical protein
MLRIISHAALLGGALALGACGFADSRAPVPEFMRMKEAEQPPPEAPPDVKRVVREQIDVVFLATSYPREVHVAPSRGARTGLDGVRPRAAHLRDRHAARCPDLHRDDIRRTRCRPPTRGRGRHLPDRDLRADLV